MRRLVLYTNKNKNRVAFDGIITSEGTLFYTHICIVQSYKRTVESILNGTFEIEYTDRFFNLNDIEDTWTRFEKVFSYISIIEGYLETIDVNYIHQIIFNGELIIPIDLDKICNFFKIKKELDEDLDCIGLATMSSGEFSIKYKETGYSQRNRFTIAHELGHIFKHFSDDTKNIFKDDEEESYISAARGREISDIEKAKLEYEANEFAAELLLPKNHLITYIDNHITKYGTKPYLTSLKNYYDVANGTMFRILKQYGLYDKVIDDGRWW